MVRATQSGVHEDSNCNQGADLVYYATQLQGHRKPKPDENWGFSRDRSNGSSLLFCLIKILERFGINWLDFLVGWRVYDGTIALVRLPC